MERSEAESVFALIADLHGELRERLVTGRWWLIWGIMGVQTFVSCVISHMLLQHWPDRTWPQRLTWIIHILLTVLVVRIVQRRVGGIRTARERMLWGIWLTFVAVACMVDPINNMLGLAPFTLLPAAALLAAFAFAMTAIGVHRAFWPAAAGFAGASLSMALWPGVRFLIYGVAWLATLTAIGVTLRPRTRAASEPL